MKKKDFLVNASSNWVGFAAQVLATFFLSPILIHGLGDRRYGVWSLVESVLAYLAVFDLGIASALVRYVARFEARDNRDGLNRVFNTSLALFAAAGAVALAIVLVLALGWARPLGVPPDLAVEVGGLLLLLGLNLAVGFPLGVFSSGLDGLGRYPTKTVIRTGGLLVRSVLMLAVVRAGHGLIAVGLVVTACNLAEHALMALALWRRIPYLSISPRFVDRSTFDLIKGYSLYSFMAMIAYRISFQTDAIVIGAFLRPEFITFFTVAARLVDYTKGSLRSITTTLTPAISAMEATGDLAGIRAILVRGTRYILYLVVPVQVGLHLLGKPFIDLWLGAGYGEKVFPTLAILAVPLFLAASQSVAARVLYGIGRLRTFTAILVVEALVNLILSVALVRAMGIEGAALGTTIPTMVSCLAVTFYTCRVLEIRVTDYLTSAWPKPLLLGLILGSVWLLAGRWIPVSSWGRFCLMGSAGTIGYALTAAVLEFGHRRVIELLRRHLLAPRAA